MFQLLTGNIFILFLCVFFRCVCSINNGQEVNKIFEDCKTHNPVFSYVHGRPNITAVPGTSGLTAVLISWDVEQVLYAPVCVDAFEVEYQGVGGGRLSWSAWSAMVGCAPTRESLEHTQFSCERRLYPHDCSTRLRVRVLPHNSRSHLIPDRPSPYEEVVIICRLGAPVSVETNMFSSGRKNKPMTGREYQDQMLVARARDKILISNEHRRTWLVQNRRTTVTTTSSTSSTTLSTTRYTTTRRTTSSSTTPPQKEPEEEYTDPTLEDSFSYDEYETYYDYNSNAEKEKEEAVEAKTTDAPYSCSYTDWSEWSQCSSLCGSGTKSRTRSLTHGSVQYCSYHNQTKSCYGTSCVVTNGRSKSRATLLLGKYSQHGVERGYEVRSNLKNFTEESVVPVYCAVYEMVQVSQLCTSVGEQQLGVVCGLCTSKAVLDSGGQCRGTGELGRVTGWRMFMDSHCIGTWKMTQQVEGDCHCDEDHSFVFV